MVTKELVMKKRYYLMDKQLLKTIRFEEILQWDVKQFYITKVSSKFRIDKLGNHIIHETKKYQLSNEPDKDFNILGVSNKEGMYDAYTLKGREIKQKYHKVEDDWLVYNPYRINVGSIGLKTKDLKGEYISPAYVVFSCKETVLPEYIFFLIKTDTFNKLINDSTTGTVRQTLHFEKIAEINIPVPTIKEQKEILKEYNDTLMEIEKLKEKLHIIERKKDSYLLDELGTEIYNKQKNNNRLINTYKSSELNRWDIWAIKEKISSKKYELKKLSELVTEKPFYGANEKAVKEKTDVRYIRITDINDDGTLGNEFVSAEKVDNKYLLAQNDFLIARSGNTVGKTFLYDDSMGKALFAGYLIKFVLNKKIINPYYFLYYTKSSIFKKWIASNQRISGQPNINGQEYLSADIIVPPIQKQNEIVKKIGKYNKEYQLLNEQIINKENITYKKFEEIIFN